MKETDHRKSDNRRSIPEQAEANDPRSRRLSRGVGAADWACVAAVAAFTLAVFWRGLLNPVDIIRTDAAHQFQPFYTFTIHEVAAGRFPHWTPSVCNGVPFHATTHGAVLYPLGWPLFVFDYPIGYVLCITLHFFLTAVVMLLFLRVTLRCGPLPSLIGAVSFAFGGFTLGHVPHLNYVPSYPWFILTIFLLSQAIKRSSWVWAVAAAIPVGLSYLFIIV